MIHYIQGQKGSVVVIAIGIMLILGLFITTLLPYLSSVSKSNKMSQDKIQAQFAAEAGAKRAIASLCKFSAIASTPGKAADWIWIGKDINLLGPNNATGGSYNVTLNNSADGNSTYLYTPTDTTPFRVGGDINITIRSVGTFQAGASYPTASSIIVVVVPISTTGQVNYEDISWNKNQVKSTPK